MEALDLAGWPADDLDQRRPLPGSVGETGRVASGALLLEERGAIEWLCRRQGYLGRGCVDNGYRAAKFQPHHQYRTSFSHGYHRRRELSLVRRKQAVVVAGCFMVEQEAAGLRTLAQNHLQASAEPLAGIKGLIAEFS
jgi:hypothetical protein